MAAVLPSGDDGDKVDAVLESNTFWIVLMDKTTSLYEIVANHNIAKEAASVLRCMCTRSAHGTSSYSS